MKKMTESQMIMVMKNQRRNKFYDQNVKFY